MYEDLGFGITCIDTEYHREKMAACYLVKHENEAAIIDSGTNFSAENILKVIALNGLEPSNIKYIIPTHVHLDHAGGVGKLMQLCENAQLVIHPRGARHMIDPSKLIAGTVAVYGQEVFDKSYGELIPVPEERVIATDDTSLDLAGRTLQVIDAPGHARHHIAIVDELSKGIFTGDVFGVSYREFDTEKSPFVFPPSTPVQFEPDVWHKTLDKLMSFSPERMYLTHYSAVSGLAEMCERLHYLLDQYVLIANKHKESNDRYQLIYDDLSSLFVAELEHCGCTLSKERMMELLSVDLDLNVQGIEVWLDRSA